VSEEIEIVALGADEGPLLQRLRIAALTESPDAFSPTAAEALSHDEVYWQRAAERAASNADFELFTARISGEGLGLASAQRDAAGIGHIGAMWVDPRLRGRRAGARLFDTAVAFLRERGCNDIRLSVTETNAAAIALYQSRGFVLTGEAEPLRPGSSLRNLMMRWQADCR
jgi:ribosomal protein S18 acetylase RimI-like enzyme